MDLRRTKSKFTREQRLAIIEEYEKGTLTGKEIAQKYGFRSPSVIYNWRERLLNPHQGLRKSKKSSIFAVESHTISCVISKQILAKSLKRYEIYPRKALRLISWGVFLSIGRVRRAWCPRFFLPVRQNVHRIRFILAGCS